MRNLLAIFLFLPLAGFGQARTITVDDDRPADFNKIQTGIHLSVDLPDKNSAYQELITC